MPVADVPGLRPTSERIRETLFNWLAPTIHGARCLDLFAGTGALGFEALSRGAGSVQLVENAAVAAAQLRENIEALQATDISIRQEDAFEVLRGDVADQYDLVFIDPPFAGGRYEELCKLLDEHGWLSPGALVYIEQDRKQPAPALPAHWKIVKEKTAGNVRYALIKAGE